MEVLVLVRTVAFSVKFLKILLLPLSIVLINAPEVKFFIKMIFHVFVYEFREDLSLVPQIIDQCFECLSISIDENLSVHHL